MGKKVLVFLLLLSFIGWTKAQQEELQNGTEQSKQLQVLDAIYLPAGICHLSQI